MSTYQYFGYGIFSWRYLQLSLHHTPSRKPNR